MFKFLKEKVLGAITANPKYAMFGIGLAVTFVVGATVGLMEPSQAHALSISSRDG